MARLLTPRFAFPWFLAICTACAHVPQKSASVERAGIESSTSDLRRLAVELGRESMGRIEMAADSMDAGTSDRTVRRNTLYLRLSCVTAITEASLRPDPVQAMLDLYAFRTQLANFMTSPAGHAAFGDQIQIALRAIASNAARWEEVATSVEGHMTDSGRAELAAWCVAHPIDRLPFTRISLAGTLAAKLREEQTSIGAAVGGMQESLDRLEYRISLLNENAVKQAVWLSQLAALDIDESPDVAELRGTLHSSRALIEDAPDLVARERTVILADVDRQRRETLEAITLELDRQRVALMESVANERVILLNAVNEQRRLIMLDADSLRVLLVADEFRVVNHLMLLLAALLVTLLVTAGVGWLTLRR